MHDLKELDLLPGMKLGVLRPNPSWKQGDRPTPVTIERLTATRIYVTGWPTYFHRTTLREVGDKYYGPRLVTLDDPDWIKAVAIKRAGKVGAELLTLATKWTRAGGLNVEGARGYAQEAINLLNRFLDESGGRQPKKAIVGSISKELSVKTNVFEKVPYGECQCGSEKPLRKDGMMPVHRGGHVDANGNALPRDCPGSGKLPERAFVA
jgi:hypothetical protein